MSFPDPNTGEPRSAHADERHACDTASHTAPVDGAGTAGAATPVPRRIALQLLSAGAAATVGAVVGVPALVAFLSPGRSKAGSEEWIKVTEADQVEIGVPVAVSFVEPVSDAWVESRVLRNVWLRTEDGESFTCYSGVCPHLGCSFTYEPDTQRFHCPCHHGLFEGRTGAVVGGPPPRGLDPLPVKVEAGAVYVQYKTFRIGVPERAEA